jgi:hypothetical protein
MKKEFTEHWTKFSYTSNERKTDLFSVINNHIVKNSLKRNDPLARELKSIFRALYDKRIDTIEKVKQKGPAALVKFCPGISINRINLLYTIIGEDPPYEYSLKTSVKYTFNLKKKYETNL